MGRPQVWGRLPGGGLEEFPSEVLPPQPGRSQAPCNSNERHAALPPDFHVRVPGRALRRPAAAEARRGCPEPPAQEVARARRSNRNEAGPEPRGGRGLSPRLGGGLVLRLRRCQGPRGKGGAGPVLWALAPLVVLSGRSPGEAWVGLLPAQAPAGQAAAVGGLLGIDQKRDGWGADAGAHGTVARMPRAAAGSSSTSPAGGPMGCGQGAGAHPAAGRPTGPTGQAAGHAREAAMLPGGAGAHAGAPASGAFGNWGG